MKTTRLFIIALSFVTSILFVDAKTTSNNNHECTNVTKSMVRKIKAIYDADEVFRRTFNDWYDCSSWAESSEKMDEIMANPNLAKPIIYHILGFWGTGDIGYTHLTRNYGFTDSEYRIALDIYDEKYHFRQREAEEEQQRINEKKARQQQIQREADAETALLNKWRTNGSDFFSVFPKENGVHPQLDVKLDQIVERYDLNGNAPRLSRMGETTITLELLSDKTIRNVKVSGNLYGIVDAIDISVIEPPKYKFKYLICQAFPISCNYPIDIVENGDLLGNIKCKVKYNNKKELWEIEILDYTSFMGMRESIFAYENLYKRTKFNNKISQSAKDAIALAVAKAINSDESLKGKLLKGKHTIECSVYNHWIRYNRKSYDLQPFVDNITIQ